MRIRLMALGVLVVVAVLLGVLAQPALAGWAHYYGKGDLCSGDDLDVWRVPGNISDYYYGSIKVVVDPTRNLDVRIGLFVCYYDFSGDAHCRPVRGGIADVWGKGGKESLKYYVGIPSYYSEMENLFGFFVVGVYRVSGCGSYRNDLYIYW